MDFVIENEIHLNMCIHLDSSIHFCDSCSYRCWQVEKTMKKIIGDNVALCLTHLIMDSKYAIGAKTNILVHITLVIWCRCSRKI
jgi:hypothetical protein